MAILESTVETGSSLYTWEMRKRIHIQINMKITYGIPGEHVILGIVPKDYRQRGMTLKIP